MSENKEYLTTIEDSGSINISEEVVGSIASIALGEVEGVAGLAAGMGAELAEKFGRKSTSKGVKLLITEEEIRIDCFIMVKYGYAIQDVAASVQEAVANAVESMTGLKVTMVNVSVVGIAFDK
ncbi:MAG: Asp23/Gls24 family envelope stress response protein [Ruminococcaceae bacterium]|nr:Asp23/Gls24 family envelope stress response protein [Oscillospiraceae bacterium]